ncbi:unnamed protein product [Leuciscus chuanchicus]
MNTRTTDSGLYEVTIRGSKTTFTVTVYGVFADTDAVKSVSVMEGDSVTLNSDTELKDDDVIEWRFGTYGPLIARINRELDEIFISDGTDGRFRDRLKVDNQTGSLTIMNTRTTDSGLYEVTIRGSKTTFTVTVYGPDKSGKELYERGTEKESDTRVFADTDAVKSVSVMEGDSVTLNSSLTEIQRDEEIFWRFGTNGSLIAKTDGVKNTIPDDLNERFRDRLKLDKKTGSLTIMNIRTEDAGVYEVEISNSRSETKHRFTVTVYGPDKTDKELYERGTEQE